MTCHRSSQDDYVYLSRCGLSGLAWEFLRRNDGFRAAWQRYQEANTALGDAVESGSPDMEDYKHRRSIAFKAASHPWGLLRPCDPDQNALTARPEWRAGDLGSGVSMFSDDYEPPPCAPGDEDGLLIPVYLNTGPVDLRKSIDLQIAALRNVAISKQRRLKEQYPELMQDPTKISGKEKRVRMENLRRYLQAYDARMAGASFRQIGALFSSASGYENQGPQGKRHFDCACAYIEGGYRTLLLKA